jgi:Tol biopolymer transport system component
MLVRMRHLRTLAAIGSLLVVGAGCTQIDRVSVASNEQQSSAASTGRPAASTGAQVVAFTAGDDALVPADANGHRDVFARDVAAGTTEIDSVTSTGSPATGGDSTDPHVSDDGRFLAFTSAATNLRANDTNNVTDVFLHDRDGGLTLLVSRRADGAPANGASRGYAISGNGRFVLFTSTATDLAGAAATAAGVYIANTSTGVIARVAAAPVCSYNGTRGTIRAADMDTTASKFAFVEECPEFIGTTLHVFAKSSRTAAPTEVEGYAACGPNGTNCQIPALDLSNDGSTLAWVFHEFSGRNDSSDLTVWDGSGAPAVVTDAATGNTVGASDVAVSPDGRHLVYVRADWPDETHSGELRVFDRQTNTSTLFVTSLGGEPRIAIAPAWSPDGTHVAFVSAAPDLVSGDTNGVADTFVRPFPATAATPASTTRVAS